MICRCLKKNQHYRDHFKPFWNFSPKKIWSWFFPKLRYKNALKIEHFHHFLSNVTFKTFPVVGKLYDWPDGLWHFGSFQSFARRWGWFCPHETEGLRKVNQSKKVIFPIPSMVMVYLPTWMVDFYGFHVGKHTVHGWYGFVWKNRRNKNYPSFFSFSSLK